MIYLFIQQFICHHTHLIIKQSLDLFIYLNSFILVYIQPVLFTLFIYSRVPEFIKLSLCPQIYLFILQFLHLFIYPRLPEFIKLSLCTQIYLFIHLLDSVYIYLFILVSLNLLNYSCVPRFIHLFFSFYIY